MYPNLTPFLVGLGGAGLLLTVVLALRGPLTRRLALRQLNRRRAEADITGIHRAHGYDHGSASRSFRI